MERVIIWGDEQHNASKQTALKRWSKTNAAVFGASTAGDGGGGEASVPAAGPPEPQKASEEPAKPIPRDGPIPPYTRCSL